MSAGVRYVVLDAEVAEDEIVLAEIQASFCAVYRCSEPLSDNELREFVEHNVTHNVWPFWREHALRLSAEAKLPRPLVPLMKPKG